MPKSRKRSTLPRLTVLSMSRRELVAFTSAVEQLARRVAELDQVVEQQRAALAELLAAQAAAVAPPPFVPSDVLSAIWPYLTSRMKDLTFRAVWRYLADSGLCDGIDGAEYRRVASAWNSAGRPSDVEVFIRSVANAPAPPAVQAGD